MSEFDCDVTVAPDESTITIDLSNVTAKQSQWMASVLPRDEFNGLLKNMFWLDVLAFDIYLYVGSAWITPPAVCYGEFKVSYGLIERESPPIGVTDVRDWIITYLQSRARLSTDTYREACRG